jgi:hypothetical protein
MPVEREDTGTDAPRFAHTLSDLKRRGCALLVVGTVPNDMYDRASQQMLGDDRAEAPRRRLVVAGDGTAAARLAATGPTTPEYARIVARDAVDGDVATPSDAAVESAAAAKVHHVDASLHELGSTLTQVVDQFEAAAGGLDPAELRVAFDSLPALAEEYDEATLFRFLHVLTNQIRARNGMAHFHLPGSVDDRTIRAFEPLFDAVVELRGRGDELQQRWHFVDGDFVSEWLAVVE